MATVLVAVVAIAAAAFVAVVWGWKFVIAPLIGASVWAWGTATLRSFRRGAHGVALTQDQQPPAAAAGPTLYWCEECGAELLVVAAGSGVPPRHCGARMHARTEV